MSNVQPISPEFDYTNALKLPSDGSVRSQTRQFSAITAGPYGPQNQICRIPLVSPDFLNLSQAYVNLSITNTGTESAYIDGSCHSLWTVSRLDAPSGDQVSYVNQYGALHSLMSSIEYSRESKERTRNMLEGFSTSFSTILVAGLAAGSFQIFIRDEQSGATKVLGTITTGTPRQIRAHSAIFETTATVNQILINGTVLTGSPQAIVFSSGDVHYFSYNVGATTIVIDNGASVSDATPANRTSAFYRENATCPSAWGNQVLTPNETRTFSARLPSFLLNSMRVLYPAFASAGQGLILQLEFAPANAVLTSCRSGVAVNYSCSDIRLFAPCISMPQKAMALKSFIQQKGALPISCADLAHQVVNLQAGSMQVPLSTRYRSLRSLILGFQLTPNYPDLAPLTSGRSFPIIGNGSISLMTSSGVRFPANPIVISSSNLSQSLAESLRGVGKYAEYSHSGDINSNTYGDALYERRTSTYFFSIDMESMISQATELGMNLTETSEQLYLAIDGVKNVAGVCNVWSLFDAHVNILANGDIQLTK